MEERRERPESLTSDKRRAVAISVVYYESEVRHDP